MDGLNPLEAISQDLNEKGCSRNTKHSIIMKNYTKKLENSIFYYMGNHLPRIDNKGSFQIKIHTIKYYIFKHSCGFRFMIINKIKMAFPIT